MKNLLFAIALVLSTTIYAQERNEKTYPFVRVFDQLGQKINKGHIVSVDNTTLFLKSHNQSVGISYLEIGIIKTKRSAGNNVLMGATIGGAAMGILGAATADPDGWLFNYSAGEGFAMGTIFGGTAGSVLGAATIPLKNSKTFIINGDINNWNAFRESVLGIKNDSQNKILQPTPPIL